MTNLCRYGVSRIIGTGHSLLFRIEIDKITIDHKFKVKGAIQSWTISISLTREEGTSVQARQEAKYRFKTWRMSTCKLVKVMIEITQLCLAALNISSITSQSSNDSLNKLEPENSSRLKSMSILIERQWMIRQQRSNLKTTQTLNCCKHSSTGSTESTAYTCMYLVACQACQLCTQS